MHIRNKQNRTKNSTKNNSHPRLPHTLVGDGVQDVGKREAAAPADVGLVDQSALSIS